MAKKGRGRPSGKSGASGKGELLGKRIWKKYPNHYLAAGGIAGLAGIVYAQQQGWIPEIIPLDILGLGAPTPWAITNPVVTPGSPVGVTGKAKSQVYYSVTDPTGKPVGSGVLGGPGAVNASIPTAGLPEADYSVTLSDTPIAGGGAAGAGGTTGAGPYNMTTISKVGGQPNPVWSPQSTIADNQAQGFMQTQGGSNITLSKFGRIVPLGTV